MRLMRMPMFLVSGLGTQQRAPLSQPVAIKDEGRSDQRSDGHGGYQTQRPNQRSHHFLRHESDIDQETVIPVAEREEP